MEKEPLDFARSTRSPRLLPASDAAPEQALAVFGDGEERLACVDAAGRLLWARRFPGVIAPLAWDEARVFAGDSDGTLTALRRVSGDVLGSRAAGRGLVAPCGASSTVVVGTGEGDLTVLDAPTGSPIRGGSVGRSLAIPIWRRPFEAPLAGAVLGLSAGQPVGLRHDGPQDGLGPGRVPHVDRGGRVGDRRPPGR
jgi:outer membrane protein assembly factor BamB